MEKKFERQSPEIIARARRLRKHLSLPERLLWRRLQKRNGNQFKIRRQIPLLNRYVVDFFYEDQRIAFEIDSSQAHDDRNEYDQRRQADIEAIGIVFVRIPARWVLRAPDEVADFILKICSCEIGIEDLDDSLH
ncbi:MAG: DUF559 domain-containing protein [Armatimonadetes bacterium]|nr:DUF559 domain-containing protein [Armatimonadota bacterium]